MLEKININGLNEVIYKGKCNNGLIVYLWSSPKLKSTFMSLSVKYGSLDTEYIVNNVKHNVPNGTAHFLEHIKFNEKEGTAHEFFHKTGADVNAFTTFKYTSYIVYAMNNVKDNLNHLLSFVETPYFNNKMIQKEKGIILEEAKMGEDDPGTVGYFGFFGSLFKNSKYRNLVTGNQKEIKSISLKDIKDVYKTFYCPNNMFLTVTGNINPYETFAWIEDTQKQFKSNNNRIEKIIPKEPYKVNEEKVIKEANIKTPNVKIALKIPRKIFKDYSDIEIRVYISLLLDMNFGITNSFNEELMKNKLITDLGCSSNIYDDYVIISVSFDSNYYEQVLKMVNDKLHHLEINEKDFERKVHAKIATLILSFDDVENVNYQIQDSVIDYGEIIPDIKKFWESLAYEKLSKINSLINFKNKAIYIMVPKTK